VGWLKLRRVGFSVGRIDELPSFRAASAKRLPTAVSRSPIYPVFSARANTAG
jgi:hypothetical protein